MLDSTLKCIHFLARQQADVSASRFDFVKVRGPRLSTGTASSTCHPALASTSCVPKTTTPRYPQGPSRSLQLWEASFPLLESGPHLRPSASTTTRFPDPQLSRDPWQPSPSGSCSVIESVASTYRFRSEMPYPSWASILLQGPPFTASVLALTSAAAHPQGTGTDRLQP